VPCRSVSLQFVTVQKYTPNFEKYRWQEIVIMNDSDLSDKGEQQCVVEGAAASDCGFAPGVAALGARRKLLKVRSCGVFAMEPRADNLTPNAFHPGIREHP
jgi:hypothetical protein